MEKNIMIQISDQFNSCRNHLQSMFKDDQHNGVFDIDPSQRFRVIIGIELTTSGLWEHVSVSKRSSIPTYEEMAWVRENVWLPEANVVQYSVARSDHVNIHKNCLHMWRPVDQKLPLPDSVT